MSWSVLFIQLPDVEFPDLARNMAFNQSTSIYIMGVNEKSAQNGQENKLSKKKCSI